MKILLGFVVIVAALGSSACGSEGPAMKAARELADKANDERKAVDVRDGAGPQEIRCDAGTPNLLFFDSTSGDALVFYVKTNSGRIVCYDRYGYSRRYGVMLKGVNRNMVDEILSQPCPPAPPAPVVQPIVVAPPTPAPLVVETPLPQLSEGPCCLDR